MKFEERKRRERLAFVNDQLRTGSMQLYARMLSSLLDAHRDKPYLKELSDAVRRRDPKGIYDHGCFLSQQQYPDATNHFVGNQFSLLIKKYPWKSSDIGTQPLETAEAAFFNADKRCGRINRKFEILSKDPSKDRFRIEGKRAMVWIRSVIGTTPNYRAIFDHCDYGRGASVGVHGDATHLLRKLSNEQSWTVTPGALHHGFGAIMHNHHFVEKLFEVRNGMTCFDYSHAFDGYVASIRVVNSNKIGFVAKTAKTHRSIATEPLLNGLYQKGIDEVLRKKLRKVGIDLTDQSLNQRMAREGSLDDSGDGFVTLDLRGASNSVSMGPVSYLLPTEWTRLLMRTRSPKYSYKGVETPYNMLCSMGNGFCFPIETLVFAAICHACDCGISGKDFSVYGDDIIVRKRYAAKVIAMLKHYGFQLNTDKSFVDGPFRESCGADWFGGEDVRPFTLDFAMDNVSSMFKILNLTQRSERTSSFFAPVRRLLIEALPADFRFFRPLPGNDDDGINSLGDEHLSEPQNCRFYPAKGGGGPTWKWRVLRREGVVDFDRLLQHRNEPWLMGIALRGASSIPFGLLAGLPEVTFRRKTRTKVAWESYPATSNWLPAPELHRRVRDSSNTTT